MTAVALEWTDDVGAPIGPLTFTALVPGIPSAAQTVRLYNSFADAGVEEARELFVDVLARNSGVGTFSGTHPAVTLGCIQLAVTDTFGDAEAQLRDFLPYRNDRPLSLLSEPSGTGREIQVRVNARPGIGTAIDVLLSPRYSAPASPISGGIAETGGQGVLTGTGDAAFSWLLSGGTVTAAGSPDNTVSVAVTQYVAKGIPNTLQQQLVTLDGNDGANAALTSGHSYLATLYGKSDGTIGVEKSVQGVSPLSPTLRPAVPAGGVFLAYVEREEDATIESGDISQADLHYGFLRVTYSSLTATISPGEAQAGNALLRFETENTVALTDEATNKLWLLPAGVFEKTVTGNGSGYLINNGGGYAAGSTALTLDTGTGTIFAGDSIQIGSYTYPVTVTLAANVVTIAAPGLLAAVADDAPVAVVPGSAKPDPQALLLAEAPTTGGAVTAAARDMRTWTGPRVVWAYMQLTGTLDNNDLGSIWIYPETGDGYISICRGLTLGLEDTGTVSGSTKVDVLRKRGTGSFTTIFTDTSPNDLRMSVAAAATTFYDKAAKPQVLNVRAGDIFQPKVVAEPAGTNATSGIVCIPIEVLS